MANGDEAVQVIIPIQNVLDEIATLPLPPSLPLSLSQCHTQFLPGKINCITRTCYMSFINLQDGLTLADPEGGGRDVRSPPPKREGEKERKERERGRDSVSSVSASLLFIVMSFPASNIPHTRAVFHSSHLRQ